jgi:hypothetical protein
MGEWLIPWKERGRSGPVKDSFLWHSDRLYVMDNHRLALWCWWQHLDNDRRGWNFFHVDRHYDALWQRARPWLDYHNPNHRLDLNSFRQAKFSEQGEELNLYRWDVIISALLTLDGKKIHRWVFATAGLGESPPISNLEFINPWNLPAQLRWMATPNGEELPSIIDIDLDYFTYFDDNGFFGRVFSDQYLRELSSTLGEGLTNKRFGVVTVALSPTTTGSWQLAEELCWALLESHPDLPELREGAP